MIHEHDGPRVPGRETDTVRRAAELLQALADPARLELVELISQGEVCVAELVGATGAHESTVSQRLRTLRDRRVVTTRRDGKHVFYSLADDHVRELVQAVLDHVDHLNAPDLRPSPSTAPVPARTPSPKGTP
jgi:ArsR family transcriptional regulator, lead/cadmium/zinc/bismuth-responsive transcriptional repressor